MLVIEYGAVVKLLPALCPLRFDSHYDGGPQPDAWYQPVQEEN